MATCNSLCLDGQSKLACLALLRAARQLDPNMPAGLNPFWSWLGELSTQDIPF